MQDDKQSAARESELSSLLFPRRGYFGSSSEDDAKSFAEFCAVADRRRAAASASTSAAAASTSAPEPAAASTYDHRYRCNFALLSEGATAEDPLGLRRLSRERRGRLEAAGLDEAKLKEARLRLHLFEDFGQKKRLGALQKMQRDRARLPIASCAAAILDALRGSQVLLLSGDTGCGKSTQLPQILLQGGYDRVACTQPRRLAAIALARRVAIESLDGGTNVGYSIRFEPLPPLCSRRRSLSRDSARFVESRRRALLCRFESSSSSESRIVFLTEGVLLRQLAAKPLLPRYSVIVLDEAHERHVSTDLLIGSLRALLPRRPDLRLVSRRDPPGAEGPSPAPHPSAHTRPFLAGQVIMSATLNSALFEATFPCTAGTLT